MRKSLWMVAVVFAAIGAPTVLRAQTDLTYAVNQTVGAGSVTGTITTDGTIGGIGAGNIVGWNLTLADGANTLILTPTNSSVTDSGCCGNALTATPTDLTFNFGLSEEWGSQFDFNGIGPTVGSLCISAYCVSGSGIDISNLESDGDNVYAGEFSVDNIATVTPEPGTAVLWLTGIGLMIVVMRRAQLQKIRPTTI